jgi:protein-tyrosine phosphatase
MNRLECEMTKVLFVCLGNICRSPTAEGVFRKLLEDRKMTSQFDVDSAGTSDWHEGHSPDPRSQEEARRRGIDLGFIRSRPVRPEDFTRFDYIVAMDNANLDELEERCPDSLTHRLHLFTSFAPELGITGVPDPYYGGPKGFERVFDIIEASARGLLAHIERAKAVSSGADTPGGQ